MTGGHLTQGCRVRLGASIVITSTNDVDFVTPEIEALNAIDANDGDAVAADQIPVALTAAGFRFEDGATQQFTAAGVRWSLDDGPWQPARTLDAPSRWAWTPFQIDLTVTAGRHLLRTRAQDADGSQQPERQPYHRDGILWHAQIPHPLHVA